MTRTNLKPATPLPWRVAAVEEGRFPCYPINDSKGVNISNVYIHARGGSNKDAEYIAHACNAYPKLVDAVQMLTYGSERNPEAWHFAMRLLRELGESA